MQIKPFFSYKILIYKKKPGIKVPFYFSCMITITCSYTQYTGAHTPKSNNPARCTLYLTYNLNFLCYNPQLNNNTPTYIHIVCVHIQKKIKMVIGIYIMYTCILLSSFSSKSRQTSFTLPYIYLFKCKMLKKKSK